MNGLLRKIRREGSSSKYLRYALGELLLVVLGILIALQINDWNEERKEKMAYREFLNNLKLELTLDVTTLERKIQEFGHLNLYVRAGSRLLDTSTSASQAELDSLTVALTVFNRLTPFLKNTGRNDTFIGEGRLESIDPELNRNYLTYLDNNQASATLASKLGDALKLIEINQFHQKVKYNSVSAGDSADIDFDILELRNDLAVKNGFSKSIFWREVYVRNMQSQVDEARGLIDRIEAILSAD